MNRMRYCHLQDFCGSPAEIIEDNEYYRINCIASNCRCTTAWWDFLSDALRAWNKELSNV